MKQQAVNSNQALNFSGTVCRGIGGTVCAEYPPKSAEPVFSVKDLFPELPDEFAVAAASALSAMIQSDGSGIEMVKDQQVVFSHRVKIRNMVYGGLTGAFLLLLVNFFVYNHYRNKNSVLQEQLVLSQGEVMQTDSLKNKLDEQKKLLGTSGMELASRTSYYADALTQDVPATISLTRLCVQPQHRVEEGSSELISFINKQISVEGNCREGFQLNEWMHVIGLKNWVGEVRLISYKDDPEKEMAHFILEISVKS